MNIEQARFNMIEQQIRPWNVLDPDVLDLLVVVKREHFVPEAYKSLAFSDAEIPLGGGASSTLDTAVTNSINDGISYSVAAGNDNVDACNGSPSRVAAAITVGSTTSSDARSSFSNWGTCLDIFGCQAHSKGFSHAAASTWLAY